MKLNDLLVQLAQGELSNLSMAASGEIKTDSHAKVILAINSALRDIFSRVPLAQKEVIIQTLDWKSVYHLRVEHSKLNPTPGYLKYILDMPNDRFTGDVVKVLGVTNEVGDPLPINDAEQWASVFFPAFDTVQFNHPGAGQVFSVQYQALHDVLKTSGDGYLDQEIRIPAVLEDMVKIRTAYNIIAPMGGQDQTIKAQALDAMYEGRHTSLVLNNDAGDTGVSTNIKLLLRGYP